MDSVLQRYLLINTALQHYEAIPEGMSVIRDDPSSENWRISQCSLENIVSHSPFLNKVRTFPFHKKNFSPRLACEISVSNPIQLMNMISHSRLHEI